MPNTRPTLGTSIADAMEAMVEEYSQEWTTQRPLVVSRETSDIIREMGSTPGSVVPIPEGSIREMDRGETISIPFVNGSNARIADGEFIWTTEAGRRIPISKLEDDHLANIIKMLSRNMVGVDEKSRQYQRNEETLILMRTERDRRKNERVS